MTGVVRSRDRLRLLVAAVVVVAAVAAVAAVGALAVRQGAGGGGAAHASPSSVAGRPSPPARAPLAPGKLPFPTGGDVVEELTAGTFRPLGAGGAHLVLSATNLPQPGPSLAVYRYPAASGPPDGVVMTPGSMPAGLPSTRFQVQQPGDAFTAAAARAAGGRPANQQRTLRMSEARLVYIAVVDRDQGFLEPAYLFSGAVPTHSAVRVMVPALDPSILQQ